MTTYLDILLPRIINPVKGDFVRVVLSVIKDFMGSIFQRIISRIFSILMILAACLVFFYLMIPIALWYRGYLHGLSQYFAFTAMASLVLSAVTIPGTFYLKWDIT